MHQVLSPQQLDELASASIAGRSNRLAIAVSLANVKQTDIADATGFTPSYISAVIKGRYRTITVENARKFAEFFGVPIEVLFPSNTQEVA